MSQNISNRMHDREDRIELELFYPRHDRIKAIQLALIDVRAADDLRISFDFDRDGWRIEVAREDDAPGVVWIEAAFVPGSKP